MEGNMIEKAQKTAEEAHKGQYRMDGKTPYIEHPKAVVGLLEGVDIQNESTLAAAWLHDCIEDCGLTREYLEKEFGASVASTVQQLTKDVGREEYNERIMHANYDVQIIKLADTVHNCSNLSEPYIPEKTRTNKVRDCKLFYLALASKICPEFHDMLIGYVGKWL